jgi:GTP-binding protein Era
VFEKFHQEIPYSVFCRVEEYREAQNPVYIQVNVFVERDSQKRILIGKKGQAIQELGRKAREKIEDFIGQAVYLDLWIKVLPGWRKKQGELRRLGFRVGENREDAL